MRLELPRLFRFVESTSKKRDVFFKAPPLESTSSTSYVMENVVIPSPISLIFHLRVPV